VRFPWAVIIWYAILSLLFGVGLWRRIAELSCDLGRLMFVFDVACFGRRFNRISSRGWFLFDSEMVMENAGAHRPSSRVHVPKPRVFGYLVSWDYYYLRYRKNPVIFAVPCRTTQLRRNRGRKARCQISSQERVLVAELGSGSRPVTFHVGNTRKYSTLTLPRSRGSSFPAGGLEL